MTTLSKENALCALNSTCVKGKSPENVWIPEK
jgi:hypothetical protein